MTGSSPAVNGMPAALLDGVTWRKSGRSGPQGSCVEFAALPGGHQVAMRNSRFPEGPALIYGQSDVATLVEALKAGEFDQLL